MKVTFQEEILSLLNEHCDSKSSEFLIWPKLVPLYSAIDRLAAVFLHLFKRLSLEKPYNFEWKSKDSSQPYKCIQSQSSSATDERFVTVRQMISVFHSKMQ